MARVRRFEKFSHLCLLYVTVRLRIGTNCQPTSRNDVLSDGRPRGPQPSSVGKVYHGVECIDGKTVLVGRLWGARRVVTGLASAVLCQPNAARHPALTYRPR